MNAVWKLLVAGVLGFVTVLVAGVPAIIHSGKVVDAETGAPLAGVEVVGFFDEWPAGVPRYVASKSISDSVGVYHIGLNRPGSVYFIKAGYDSLVLHWPEEFDGSDRSGCGINLTPIHLLRTSR